MANATKTKATETPELLPIENAAGFDASGFDDFEDNVQQSSSIPYCQIVNPPNLQLSQLQKLNPPYGIFVPLEQAELVEFKPDETWRKEDVTFGDGDNETTITGYLATSIRVAFIHRSQIEIQEKRVDNGNRTSWRFAGLAYEKGKETQLKKDAEEDRDNYRRVNRLLILFLDKNNQPLHSSPLQLTARGGFAGALGVELKEFYKQIDGVYFKAARLAGKNPKGGSLDDQAHALAVLACELGYHKPEGKAPYVCINKRLTPAIEGIGQSKLVDRGDRKIELIGVDLWALLQRKNSELGKTILENFDSFSDFAKPNAGRSAEEEATVATPGLNAPYFGSGAASDIRYHENGDISFTLNEQKCLVKDGTEAATSIETVDMELEITVVGVHQGGSVVVASISNKESGDGSWDEGGDEF